MKKIDMVDYAEKLFMMDRNREMEDFEKEKETTKHMQFLKAMLIYLCNCDDIRLARIVKQVMKIMEEK